MTDCTEIERLLQMTGRTLEGLPGSYTVQEIEKRFSGIVGGRTFGDCLLHQSDMIELLVGALRDALGISTIEINDAQFEEFSKKAREAAMRRHT